ncbi:acyl-CoA dehydrogenase family protein [Peribacillus loiseleuriae]|uniref:acyl-CoA dehydrogenase family protein n=1 Tax=Peribacillus loiseleuriae TaxID=1679170 RepID=UPI003D084594
MLDQLTLTHEEAVERAKNLATQIKPRFKITEELRHQPQETIQDFIDSGLIRTVVPKRWGGYELGFNTLFRTGVEVAKADPSAGWVYTLLLVHTWMLAYFSEEAQRDVWEVNPDATIATTFNPFSKNEMFSAEGGYQLSGQWGFSSGVDHCDWVLIQGNIDLNQDGEAKEIVAMLVPKSDFKIQKTWKTIAQRGTGSNTILLENVFIPKYRTIDLVAWCQRGEGSDKRTNTSFLYSHPLFAGMLSCLVSTILGASIGAYELWRDSIKNKVSLTSTKVADYTHQQIRVAEVSASLAAAEALMEKIVERLDSGDPIDTYEKLRIRRNYAYITKLCNKAVRMIVDSSGAGSMYESSPLQRYWRDVQGSSMHFTLNMDWVGEMFGKAELGISLNPKDTLIS